MLHIERDHIINTEQNRILCCSYNNDGTKIAVGSSRGNIFILDSTTGSITFRFDDNSGMVNAVAFNHDGSKVVSGNDNGYITLWSPDGGAFRIQAHPSSKVNAVAFNSNGSLIASASNDSFVKIWNSATGSNMKILRGHSSWVKSVAWHGTDHLVSGGRDKCVIFWDNEGNTTVMKGHTDTVQSVAFHPDGNLIISCSDDGYLNKWDRHTGKIVYTTRTAFTKVINRPIISCCYSNDGKRIAFATDYFIYVIIPNNVYRIQAHANINQIQFSKNDKMIVCATERQVYMANTEYNEAQLKFPDLKGLRELYLQYPLHPDDPNNYQYKFQLDSVNISKNKLTVHAFIRYKLIRNNMEFSNAGDVFKIETIHGNWKISKIKRYVNKKDTYTFYMFARGNLRSIVREIIEGKILVDDASRIMIKF